ncbi:MAG: polysaccharide deacetylase family protein [Bacteroidales bacterium]|jgi:hypothetical protein|nr:polysaccharide deacetylase family protein [Bacteroidales bacterium]
MNKLYDYLLRFLLNCPERENEILPKITYSATEEEFANYAVVIRASEFFTYNYGNKNSLPSLPLSTIEHIPFFYGTSHIEKQGNTIIIHADLIASAFVLLSRYEEWVQPDLRDEHGRFPAHHSIAYKGGFLHRPIVDEYGALLRKYLRQVGIEVPEPAQQFNKIYLTHDVDFLTRYDSFRGFCGAVWRTLKSGTNEIMPALQSLKNIHNDPFFTFSWILQKNTELASRTSATALPVVDILEMTLHTASDINNVKTLFFLKSKQYHNRYDRPFYSLVSKTAKQLIALIKNCGATIGLHTSYSAGKNPVLIAEEKQELEKACKTKITCNRNHFLRSQNPTDMDFLLQNNILHDFTLGYADCAGFRLGTCRPVHYIDVETKKVSDLILHPLLIMDSSLSDSRYMNLNENQAFEYATKLIDQVKKHHGDIVLLWHNHVFALSEKYNHRKLYTEILNYIAEQYEM